MIVKFFSNRGGGSPRSSVDYLLDQKKHDNKVEVLKGDPELSKSIAEGLEFKNAYTVGCLSFEEKHDSITAEQKQEIIERFESTIFSGLDAEQYNISWIEHSDKNGRLELNFFIPNVELTSGKRLQPYYDKADRPLVENFKQVVNHEYALSDPNEPNKSQRLIWRKDIPKEKKEALNAIDSGITALVEDGQITNRDDVIETLEKAGFEIARTTKQSISIKTDGQNLRLKGAFYEQDFRCSKGFREELESRSTSYERNSEERYQTARTRLDSAISRRKQEFTKRYRNRADEIQKKITQDFQLYVSPNTNNLSSDSVGTHVLGSYRVQKHEQMEAVSRELQTDKQSNESITLHNQRQQEPILYRDRYEIQKSILGRERKSSSITNRSGEIKNEAERGSFRESIERIVSNAREKYHDISERIRQFATREQLNQNDVQKDDRTKRTNQQYIERISAKIEIIDQHEKSQRRSNDRGMSL